jgi:hypothetical protein
LAIAHLTTTAHVQLHPAPLNRPAEPRRWIDAFLTGVRLLTFLEMQELFPDCTILRERFLELTKSYVAVRSHP